MWARHHAGYEHHSRTRVWFDGIRSTLVDSAFMVEPFELAKLVLNSSPNHTFLQIVEVEVASRVDMIPQWI